MSDQNTKQLADEGYSTVNPFIITENARGAIDFIVHVFEGEELKEGLTYDTDGLVLHSEVRIGDSTILLVDRKEGWRLTPAFLQVYVADVEATLKRAEKLGAQIVTEPTEYIGVKFSRIQDPHHNIWWVYEKVQDYDWSKASDGDDEESWKETDESIYIHDTFISLMEKLARE